MLLNQSMVKQTSKNASVCHVLNTNLSVLGPVYMEVGDPR